MPGYNGTGPNGAGPLTGGARGWCNPAGIVRGIGRGVSRLVDYGRRRLPRIPGRQRMGRGRVGRRIGGRAGRGRGDLGRGGGRGRW